MREHLPRAVMQCNTIAWIDGNMRARMTPASPAEKGTATMPVDSSAERHPTVPLSEQEESLRLLHASGARHRSLGTHRLRNGFSRYSVVTRAAVVLDQRSTASAT